jgi:hypothetical protein
MLKKIITILTSEWVKNTFAVVKYVFALIGVVVGLSLVIHSNDPVKMGPTPAQALVTIQQELNNFRMLPGSRLTTNLPHTRERSAFLQANHRGCGTYEKVHSYYIAEAERNGWILEEDDVKKQQITFTKSDFPKSRYSLDISFSGADAFLEFSWRSGY